MCRLKDLNIQFNNRHILNVTKFYVSQCALYILIFKISIAILNTFKVQIKNMYFYSKDILITISCVDS